MSNHILHFAIRFTALHAKHVACGCCHAALDGPVPGPVWGFVDTVSGPRPCCKQCLQEFVPFLFEVLQRCELIDSDMAGFGWNRVRPNHIPISEFAIQGEPVPASEQINGPFDAAVVRDVPPGEIPMATPGDVDDDDDDFEKDDDDDEL